MRKWLPLLCLALPGLAQANVDCSAASLAQPQAQRPTVMAPLSPELATPSYLLGASGGVLAHAYDESQSVDQVLLRQRLEKCRPVARAVPAGTVDPNDPAAYKPKTEFDNTPWRFDMSQGGKRMTAEEFDAWMKARGVRVARGSAPAAAPAAPAAAPAAPGAATPGQGVPPGAQPSAPAATPTPAPAPTPAPKPPQG